MTTELATSRMGRRAGVAGARVAGFPMSGLLDRRTFPGPRRQVLSWSLPVPLPIAGSRPGPAPGRMRLDRRHRRRPARATVLFVRRHRRRTFHAGRVRSRGPPPASAGHRAVLSRGGQHGRAIGSARSGRRGHHRLRPAVSPRRCCDDSLNPSSCRTASHGGAGDVWFRAGWGGFGLRAGSDLPGGEIHEDGLMSCWWWLSLFMILLKVSN